MPYVPFYCKRCKINYGEGGIHLELVKEITLSGISMACPQCGALGEMALPDGTYDVIGDQFQLVRTLLGDLNEAGVTHAEAAALLQQVQRARATSTPAEELVAKIEAESRLAQVGRSIREWLDSPGGGTRGQQLRREAILIILQLLLTPYVDALPHPGLHQPTVGIERPAMSEADLDRLAEKITEKASALRPAPTTPVGRNHSCPCGSHKRFKRCCGKSIGSRSPAHGAPKLP